MKKFLRKVQINVEKDLKIIENEKQIIEEPEIIEEIVVEELSIDGVCGVY